MSSFLSKPPNGFSYSGLLRSISDVPTSPLWHYLSLIHFSNQSTPGIGPSLLFFKYSRKHPLYNFVLFPLLGTFFPYISTNLSLLFQMSFSNEIYNDPTEKASPPLLLIPIIIHSHIALVFIHHCIYHYPFLACSTFYFLLFAPMLIINYKLQEGNGLCCWCRWYISNI